jgi:hypothetical protein
MSWAQIAIIPTNNTIDVSDAASSTNVRNIFNAPLDRLAISFFEVPEAPGLI